MKISKNKYFIQGIPAKLFNFLPACFIFPTLKDLGFPNKSIFIILLLAGKLAFIQEIAGQSEQFIWAEGISGTEDERVLDVAADPSNNDLYVAGIWGGDLSAPFPGSLQPAVDFSSTYGGQDGFVAKYDSSGTFLWAFKIGSTEKDVLNAIEVDNSGNFFITGSIGTGSSYFTGTSAAAAGDTLTNASGNDFFIAKYDSDGSLLWVRRSVADGGSLEGKDVSCSPDAVYAVGITDVDANFGSINMWTNPGATDFVLVKYDLNGTEQWVAECGGNKDDIVNSVVASGTQVFLTGSFGSSNLQFRQINGFLAATLGNTGSSTTDIFLASYNFSGSYRWAVNIGSAGSDNALGITSFNDSIYLTGGLNPDTDFPGYSLNPVPSSGKTDIFISSHSKINGNTGWVETIPCTLADGDELGNDIVVDGSGKLIVTGTYSGELIFPGEDTIRTTGASDAFIAGYSTNGDFYWAESINSTDIVECTGISAGSNGVLYGGGTYIDAVNLGPLSLPAGIAHNGYIFKYGTGNTSLNDEPCTASFIPVSNSCTGYLYNNTDATNSAVPDPGCGNYAGKDLWFKTTVPASGNLFISSDTRNDTIYPPLDGSIWKIGMAVYSGDCSSLVLDDCYHSNAGYNFRAASAYLQERTPGDTVWVRIWAINGDYEGTFSLCFQDPGHFPGWDLQRQWCDATAIIDLDTTLTPVKKGSGDLPSVSGGVSFADNISGTPDGNAAEFNAPGDFLTLSLDDTIPAGEVIHLIIKNGPSSSGIARLNLEYSDGGTSVTHSFQPEIEEKNYVRMPIVLQGDASSLNIANIGSAGTGFHIDAVDYIFGATLGGVWSGPGVSGSFLDLAGLSGSFAVTYTVGFNSVITDSMITFEILDTVSVDPGPGGDVCGKTFNLQAIPSIGIGSWSLTDGPGTVTFSPNNMDPSALATFSEYGTYQLTWKESNGSCTFDSTISIVLYDSPPADPGPYGDACSLEIRLNAVPPAGSGIWSVLSGPGTFSFSPSPAIADPILSVSEYGIYEILWTEFNGPCVKDSLLTIDFQQAPTSNPGTGGETCGSSFGLQAVPSIGTGEWSVLSGPGSASFTPSANDPVVTVSVDAFGEYDFLWTETAGSCSDDSVVKVIFWEPPLINAGLGGDVCGLDYQLDAVPSVGTGTWILETGPGIATFLPSNTVPDPVVTVSEFGDYSFFWREINGECSPGSSIFVTFHDVPEANPGSGGEVCGTTFQLGAIPGSGSGVWTMTAGPGSAVFNPSADDPSAQVTVDEYGVYTFSWTEITVECSSTNSIDVLFYDQFEVNAGEGGLVCGREFQLNAISATTADQPGEWSMIEGPGKVSYTPSASSPGVTVTVEEHGIYIFQWTEIRGDCIGSDTVRVILYPMPRADAGPDQILDYVFSTQMNANTPAFGSGSWELVSGAGEMEDPTLATSMVSSLSVGINVFGWTVKNRACPEVSDEVTIEVKDILLPTVITPNGDLLNDVLAFPGIDRLENCKIVIYNRWGTEVYRSDNYKNDWNGIDHNGRELIPDTYYYILLIEAEEAKKGFVEIRK